MARITYERLQELTASLSKDTGINFRMDSNSMGYSLEQIRPGSSGCVSWSSGRLTGREMFRYMIGYFNIRQVIENENRKNETV